MKKKRIFYLCSFKFRRVLPAVLKKRFSIPNGLKKVRMQTEARGNRARSRRCKFCLKLGRYTTVKILLWEGASREVSVKLKISAKKPEDVHAKNPQISRKKELWNGLLVGAELRAVSCFAARVLMAFVSLLCIAGSLLFHKNRLADGRQKEQ